MKAQRTTIEQDLRGLADSIANFDQGEPVKAVKELQYEAQVIDRMMNRYYTPFIVSRMLLEDYLGTVKWSYLFNKSPEICASLIWQRYNEGIEDIQFA